MDRISRFGGLPPSNDFDDSTTSGPPPFTRPPSFAPLHPSPAASHPPIANHLSNNNIKMAPIAHGSLMSPPEATPFDTFSCASPGAPSYASPDEIRSKPAPTFELLLSPPISPATKNITPSNPPTIALRDPILFPHPLATSTTESPLFSVRETLTPKKVVDEHVAARESRMFREASPPRQSEYELALEFKANVVQAYVRDRKAWFHRERAYLMKDRAQQAGRRYPVIAPAALRRSQPSPRKQSTVAARVIKPARTLPPKHTGVLKLPADPTKRVAREDKGFSSLPDFSPPTSSLPVKANSLKVDWKGAPIDLRFDPHVHLLHPDEVLLAANLRLDCATYLTSKRRIFIKRIEALRIGKEFRKTDAQQACKIDVNKASKLWQAFDKVGWLDQHWVSRFI